ncbi:hypothetical protein Pfo_013864 [Paulownia fortunei]|nr:hypothetical protein Pfo_013864 [Paulownia fortunei]
MGGFFINGVGWVGAFSRSSNGLLMDTSGAASSIFTPSKISASSFTIAPPRQTSRGSTRLIGPYICRCGSIPHKLCLLRSPTPIRFPPDNFKHSLTLFSKSFSSFPRGTCSLSVSRPYLALDRIYRPIGDAFPNNPTRRQRLTVQQGPSTTGLSPSPTPLSRGLGPDPPLRTLLQTTIRTAEPPDSQVGLFPIRSPLLGESL